MTARAGAAWKTSRSKRLQASLIGAVGYPSLWALGATWRWRTAGDEHRQAIFARAGKNHVFVKTPNGFEEKDVKVTQLTESRVVVEGLAEGDVVVTGGHQKIRDGAPVQPIDANEVS